MPKLKTNPVDNLDCNGKYFALRSLGVRAAFLFINFLLIIMALYHLKPASRSLFIEYLGTDKLPYVWIGTALIMGTTITFYHQLISRYSRFYLVLCSCLLFSTALIFFRLLFINPGPGTAISFYIFVDILSVVLVEQFWSLTNSIYNTDEGKKWYGFVGTGGLVGGVLGGGVAAFFIKHTPLQTSDLLLVAALIIFIISLLTWRMNKIGIYCEADKYHQTDMGKDGWRALIKNRYLLLIAAVLMLAQLASPIIEFQFLKSVEVSLIDQEERTSFLALFFSVLGIISICLNLGITPFVHRHLGVMAGLLAQPLMMTICSLAFFMHPTLLFGAATKISDRGFSYSITRASKELLYVPINIVLIYQAKAWIDMFGYRLFKISGSLLILMFTKWLPVTFNTAQLSWITFTICVFWVYLISVLRHDYRDISQKSP